MECCWHRGTAGIAVCSQKCLLNVVPLCFEYREIGDTSKERARWDLLANEQHEMFQEEWELLLAKQEWINLCTVGGCTNTRAVTHTGAEGNEKGQQRAKKIKSDERDGRQDRREDRKLRENKEVLITNEEAKKRGQKVNPVQPEKGEN